MSVSVQLFCAFSEVLKFQTFLHITSRQTHQSLVFSSHHTCPSVFSYTCITVFPNLLAGSEKQDCKCYSGGSAHNRNSSFNEPAFLLTDRILLSFSPLMTRMLVFNELESQDEQLILAVWTPTWQEYWYVLISLGPKVRDYIYSLLVSQVTGVPVYF